VGEFEDTRCHACGETLIRRSGYRILDYRLTPGGSCPRCTSVVPGRWATGFRRQITHRPMAAPLTILR
jgi:hypothetical protein